VLLLRPGDFCFTHSGKPDNAGAARFECGDNIWISTFRMGWLDAQSLNQADFAQEGAVLGQAGLHVTVR